MASPLAAYLDHTTGLWSEIRHSPQRPWTKATDWTLSFEHSPEHFLFEYPASGLPQIFQTIHLSPAMDFN